VLKIFHSIFGTDRNAAHYPEALVKAAIERAVDGTDPWLRGLSGYRHKLRPAVLQAIDHVVGMVDRLEPPLELSKENYLVDPLLRLFFISTDQLATLLRTDPILNEFRRDPGENDQPVWALLAMECEQRGIFGVGLQGDMLVRDVAQVTVGMTNHRLLDPTPALSETSRLLKRRAFDHLLALALARIIATQDVRENLLNYRTLLQAKLDYLQRGSWGFSDPGREVPLPVAELQGKLDDIETQLLKYGGDDHYIEKNLEILTGVLGEAQQQLWGEPLTLIVDRMGIKRSTATDDAPTLHLTELHNAAGRRMIIRLVKIPATAISPNSH
jgi:hypothetical protein